MRMLITLSLIIALPVFALQPAVDPGQPNRHAMFPGGGPQAFPGLTSEQVTALPDHAVTLEGASLKVQINDHQRPFTVLDQHQHSNGDVTVHIHSHDQEEAWFGSVTLGAEGVFGTLHTPRGQRLLSTDSGGTWLIDVPTGGVEFNRCDTPHEGRRSKLKPAAADRPDERRSDQVQSDNTRVIDLLLIYNEAFAQRYPGALVETRLNHLVAIANQTMGNSGLHIVFRLLDTTLYPYRNDNSNFDFRNDISDALAGEERPGLAGLAQQRNQLGADLVIGLRPHDIETRGSCGIAFFPEDDASLGANVVSDGASSWSFCLDDVLTHEIGHNLGATHQLGAGGGFVDARGSAFIREGRFTTIMASFGTGRSDRFRGLPMFSNPALPCGNEACGNTLDTNNAAVMLDLVDSVANYRSSASDLPVPEAAGRSMTDSDGDGVIDWLDALPFDSTETLDSDRDGRGDLGDAFPFDGTEQDDTDGDLLGNNADDDDDGDGEADRTDAFPLDPLERRDEDRDGVGDVADRFSEAFAEFRDSDADGIGNNADPDDDNDGFPEFSDLDQDLLVLSVGNRQILRFDASSGTSRGVEVPAWDSRLTFQSAMAWRRVDNTLVYTGDSGLRRLDLRNRALLGEWTPAFSDDPGAPAVGSGFPVALAALDGGERLLVARMQDVNLVTFRGREQALTDPLTNWQIDNEDDPGDATAIGAQGFLLGTRLNAIYRLSAAGVQFLAGPAAPWLGDPARIIGTSDGRLLISDRERNAVIAVNQQNGAFLGEIASLAGTGFSRPEGIALTSANELLVAAGDQDAIIAFDAGSGAYLGPRVAPGGGGLANPGQLLLVPALIDRFPEDPARQLRPNAGLWFDPASDGRGFDIQYYGTRLSVIWYSYDSLGEPVWYLAAGDLQGTSFSGTLNRFDRDLDGVASPTSVGTLELSFDSEQRAEVRWEVDGLGGTEDLQWLRFDLGLREQDNTGLWGRGDGPGWGMSLASQGDSTVAVAYIYDEAGAPRWAISEPFAGPPPYQFNMLTSFAPGLCPGCSGETDNEMLPSGTMRVQLGASPAWDSDIAFPEPLTGDWILDSTPLQLFSLPSTRPR